MFQKTSMQETQSRTIEIRLPAGRMPPMQDHALLLCRVPAVEAMAVTANRLLRFEFPATRNAIVLQRLIGQHAQNPRPSKKALDTLPLTMLESIAAMLWQESLAETPQDNKAENNLLALLVLAIETAEFRPQALVSADIETLGHADAGHYSTQLHSYYFKGQTDRDTLRAILEQNACRTDFVDKAPPDTSPDGLLMAYLACRRLSAPFAWASLLGALDADALRRYPMLAELDRHHRQLQSGGFYEQLLEEKEEKTIEKAEKNAEKTAENTQKTAECGLTPDNVLVWLDRLWGFLQQSGPRPVREVVIVEGETEKRLLPLYAQSAGMDFEQMGVYLLPAGGKNQVVNLYTRLSAVLAVPVFVLLDTDAVQAAEHIRQRLRAGDAVYHLREGEFEDMYDLDVVVKTINRHHQPHPALTQKALTDMMREHRFAGRVELLTTLWTSHNWGRFDKTDFALKMAEFVEQSARPPESIKRLLDAMTAIYPQVEHQPK